MLPDRGKPIFRKSDRVVGLTASCIQSVVLLRHRHELSRSVAIDLARVHDLPTAVRKYAEQLEVLRGAPREVRHEQAGVEAALTRGFDSRREVDRIVEIRQGSFRNVVQVRARRGKA